MVNDGIFPHKASLLTLLSDVWLWAEFPYKDQSVTNGKDTVSDLVCRTHVPLLIYPLLK